jgi:hypothetical protein
MALSCPTKLDSPRNAIIPYVHPRALPYAFRRVNVKRSTEAFPVLEHVEYELGFTAPQSFHSRINDSPYGIETRP